jgi:hypothetical protein
LLQFPIAKHSLSRHDTDQNHPALQRWRAHHDSGRLNIRHQQSKRQSNRRGKPSDQQQVHIVCVEQPFVTGTAVSVMGPPGSVRVHPTDCVARQRAAVDGQSQVDRRLSGPIVRGVQAVGVCEEP